MTSGQDKGRAKGWNGSNERKPGRARPGRANDVGLLPQLIRKLNWLKCLSVLPVCPVSPHSLENNLSQISLANVRSSLIDLFVSVWVCVGVGCVFGCVDFREVGNRIGNGNGNGNWNRNKNRTLHIRRVGTQTVFLELFYPSPPSFHSMASSS